MFFIELFIKDFYKIRFIYMDDLMFNRKMFPSVSEYICGDWCIRKYTFFIVILANFTVKE